MLTRVLCKAGGNIALVLVCLIALYAVVQVLFVIAMAYPVVMLGSYFTARNGIISAQGTGGLLDSNTSTTFKAVVMLGANRLFTFITSHIKRK